MMALVLRIIAFVIATFTILLVIAAPWFSGASTSDALMFNTIVIMVVAFLAFDAGTGRMW